MYIMLILVKGYCITTYYIMYAYTVYTTSVADKVGKFQF